MLINKTKEEKNNTMEIEIKLAIMWILNILAIVFTFIPKVTEVFGYYKFLIYVPWILWIIFVVSQNK